MPIISRIGRRSFRVRGLYACILLVLILGSLSIVYPLLLMLAGSVRGEGDAYSMKVIPEFLHDDRALYARYIEARYNAWMEHARAAHRADVFSWDQFTPPRQVDDEIVALFRRFRADRDLPLSWRFVGHSRSLYVNMWQANTRRFNAAVRAYFGNDIARARAELSINAPSFRFIEPPWEKLDDRRYGRPAGLYGRLWSQFKQQRPPHELYLCNLDGFYCERFLYPRYGRDIHQYNQSHDTDYTSYAQVMLAARVPASGLERKDWLEYVRKSLGGHFIRLDSRSAARYRSFLRERFQGQIDRLNRSYEVDYPTLDDMPFPHQLPQHIRAAADWLRFVEQHAEPEDLIVFGPRQAWQQVLAGSQGVPVEQVGPAPLPTAIVDYADMREHATALRWEFLTRHYRYVMDYVMLHGRAIYNTAVYCILLIGAQLLFNPLAAYALSRFKLPSTYTLLLICLLTMAFPPEVIMIPAFLLLRSFPVWPLIAAAISSTVVVLAVSGMLRRMRPHAHRDRRAAAALLCGVLGGIVGWVWLWRLFGVTRSDVSLLNSFYALILPSVAEGFAIFLLKGFFDSLPRELYESSDIDGASEWTKFWMITMSLSKPILAVLALGAFTSAYSNFMFALILIPDQKMWTLMVWLYELQRISHPSVVFASLVLAAIPTFVVFLFCQNVIMRGIVVPVEK